MTAKTLSFLKHWLPPLIWSAAILVASGAEFSASHTGIWLRMVFERVLGHDLQPDVFDTAHAYLRKTGHLTAYGILSALWFRALRSNQRTPWLLRWATGAVVLAVLVAITDEWHQSFIPSRTGAVHDVFLDTGGAVLALALLRIAQVLIILRS